MNIAEGSLAEVGYCLHVAYRLGYIDEQLLHELEADMRGVGAPLAGLVRSTRASLATSALAIVVTALVVYLIV